MMKKKRNIIAILILVALPILFFIFDEKVSPSKRGVAAVGEAASSADLSSLSPDEFKKAFKYQLLKKVSTEDDGAGIGIRLGHFLMKDESGQIMSVCDRYPTLEMNFAAEGVAIAGEVPVKTIRGSCVLSDDGQTINPVYIPYSAFAKAGSAQWNWVGLRFVGDNEADVLTLDGYEVISVLGAPYIVQPGK